MSTGAAGGASGTFTVTLVKPGPRRQVTEHWAYDTRDGALAELGLIADRAPPGTELVLRDPEGLDVLRLAKLA